MTDPSLVKRFAEAVSKLESSGDPSAITELYASDCIVGNVVDDEVFEGHDGVREFWTKYLDQFDALKSEFSVVAGDETGGVAEWTSTGTSGGNDVEYRGATVIEIEDDRIVRSMAYFDPGRLGRQIVDTADVAGNDASAPSADHSSHEQADGDDEQSKSWSGPATPGQSAPEAVE